MYVNGKTFTMPATTSSYELIMSDLSVHNVTGDVYLSGTNLMNELKNNDA